MKNATPRIPATVIAFALSMTLPVRADDGPSDALHSFIEQGMTGWSVTGLSIAVVKQGDFVFLRGYGLRDVRTGEPVDEHTVFQIGSCSKPLTATAMARLVSEGDLQWDARVADVWPGFHTRDPTVTDQATLRDLLCHRTGVGEAESTLYYEMPISRNELLARLPQVRQAIPFRTGWRYSNLMYVVAGRMAEQLTGSGWDDFMRQRLFEPLEMDRTFTSRTSLASIRNVAVPHVRVGDETFATQFADQDNIGAGGAICSSAGDLSRWLMLMTQKGEFHGRQLIPPAAIDEMTTPQVLMPFVDPVHGPHIFNAYGLGVMLFDYHGRRLAQHAGMAGHSMAMVGFVPEDRVGVAVLTNHRPSLFHYAVFRRAIDLYCGEQPIDLDTPNRKLFDEHFTHLAATVRQREAERDPRKPPTLDLRNYCGVYEGAFGLRATIAMESDALILRYGNFIADVEHWHDDTFRARLRERRLESEQDWYLTFTIADAAVMELHIDSEHDIHGSFVPAT